MKLTHCKSAKRFSAAVIGLFFAAAGQVYAGIHDPEDYFFEIVGEQAIDQMDRLVNEETWTEFFQKLEPVQKGFTWTRFEPTRFSYVQGFPFGFTVTQKLASKSKKGHGSDQSDHLAYSDQSEEDGTSDLPKAETFSYWTFAKRAFSGVRSTASQAASYAGQMVSRVQRTVLATNVLGDVTRVGVKCDDFGTETWGRQFNIDFRRSSVLIASVIHQANIRVCSMDFRGADGLLHRTVQLRPQITPGPRFPGKNHPLVQASFQTQFEAWARAFGADLSAN